MNEVEAKLHLVRDVLAEHRLAAVRLKGLDWFSWITGGGSSAVLLTAETGPADVLVTSDGAFILTDAIEHERLAAEEVPGELQIVSRAWEAPERTDEFVRDRVKGGAVASDRPAPGERGLPAPLLAAKRRLMPAEIDRYRRLAVDAAMAMTDALTSARPDWTEHRLAGEGARALWERGIHPALTLVAGESRLPRYRHPVATAAPLGAAAMLVFCGRRHGLYANLTRFVFFRAPSLEERRRRDAVASVEATAFGDSRPGTALSKIYHALASAYARVGFAGEETRHHQGGSTGYLAREAIATPTADTRIDVGTPLAWNPSVSGAKIEDTVVCTRDGVEVLTVDPRWPTFSSEGRPRPDVLVVR